MVIRRAVDAAAHIVGATMVNFFKESNQQMVIRVSKAPKGVNCEGMAVPLDLGIVGFVAKTGRTVNIKDVTKDWRHSAEADNRDKVTAHSVLVVPIRNEQGNTVALLEAVNSERFTGFTEEDETQLKSIACLCGSLMRKQKMEGDLDSQTKQVGF